MVPERRERVKAVERQGRVEPQVPAVAAREQEALVWRELVRQELVKKELVKKELVKKELVKKELVKKELVKKELVKKELVKKGPVKKGLVKKGPVDGLRAAVLERMVPARMVLARQGLATKALVDGWRGGGVAGARLTLVPAWLPPLGRAAPWRRRRWDRNRPRDRDRRVGGGLGRAPRRVGRRRHEVGDRHGSP